MAEFSEALTAKIQDLFPQDAGDVIATLRRECDETPGERLPCAILKLSEGSRERLETEIKRAKVDWRDVLLSAEFGQLEAHEAWLKAMRP